MDVVTVNGGQRGRFNTTRDLLRARVSDRLERVEDVFNLFKSSDLDFLLYLVLTEAIF